MYIQYTLTNFIVYSIQHVYLFNNFQLLMMRSIGWVALLFAFSFNPLKNQRLFTLAPKWAVLLPAKIRLKMRTNISNPTIHNYQTLIINRTILKYRAMLLSNLSCSHDLFSRLVLSCRLLGPLILGWPLICTAENSSLRTKVCVGSLRFFIF